jgi:hypothetical protein
MQMKKTIIKKGILYLTVIVFMSSCGSLSISQKRYSNGLNISWFSGKDNKQETKKELTKKKTKENTISELSNSTEIVSESELLVNEEITHNDPVVLESNLFENHKEILVKERKELPVQSFQSVESSSKNIGKMKRKMILKNSPKIKQIVESTHQSGALKGIGWVFIVIGILFLLLINIVLGALLMLLGLVFVLAGS